MDLPYLYTGHARDLSLVLNLHCYTIRFWNSLSHLQKELFLRKFKKQPQNSNKSQGTRVTKLHRTIDIAVSNQNPNRNLLWEKKNLSSLIVVLSPIPVWSSAETAFSSFSTQTNYFNSWSYSSSKPHYVFAMSFLTLETGLCFISWVGFFLKIRFWLNFYSAGVLPRFCQIWTSLSSISHWVIRNLNLLQNAEQYPLMKIR